MRNLRPLSFLALAAGFVVVQACSGSDGKDLFASGPNGTAPDAASTNDAATSEDASDLGSDASDEDANGSSDSGPSPADAGTLDASPDDGGDDGDAAVVDASDAATTSPMTFFVTSVSAGHGGNLGGLTGADETCEKLAQAAGAGAHKWHAYLSVSSPADANGTDKSIDARARIGTGPWRNHDGKLIAKNLVELHTAGFVLEDALDEKGAQVPATDRLIYTGTKADGTADTATCGNWKKGGALDGTATAGVASGEVNNDKVGRWNSGSTLSCTDPIVPVGNPGRIYCFAVD